jgi:hypothetical protein
MIMLIFFFFALSLSNSKKSIKYEFLNSMTEQKWEKLPFSFGKYIVDLVIRFWRKRRAKEKEKKNLKYYVRKHKNYNFNLISDEIFFSDR